jgi:hypothetical protein
MAVFDALPERVRRVIAEADIAYDPATIARRIDSRRSQKRVIAEIVARTARRMARI